MRKFKKPKEIPLALDYGLVANGIIINKIIKKY